MLLGTGFARATRMADALVENGVYVVSFSYPVVPQGKARIRVQVSAAHIKEELDFAAAQFLAAQEKEGALPHKR
jgi:glycine C-acetyltransferase